MFHVYFHFVLPCSVLEMGKMSFLAD